MTTIGRDGGAAWLGWKDIAAATNARNRHYGSFASEAFRISRSLRTKMCLFA